MKIVIAPDSFKESLTALHVCEALEKGIKTHFPNAEISKVPMADGGEGTVQSLVDATGGQIIQAKVTGPLGKEVEAFYGILGDGKTAVIEMAAASGLHQVPMDERNPLITTTRGTGELILKALDQKVKHIIIGIGGSATNDGGAGMVKALGAKLLNTNGAEIKEGGGSLNQLAAIDLTNFDSRLAEVKVEVACDVDNPLTGATGASAVFGPQKGATPDMVKQLDRNLAHYAAVIEKEMDIHIQNVPGAGAAGGLGGGLLAFLSAELKPGVDIVIEATQLESYIKNADLVITGEGRIDGQTIYGKTPIGVAKTAKKHSVPVIAIAGSIGAGSEAVYEHGISALFSVVPGAVTLPEALEKAGENIERTAKNVASVIRLGIK
ncbi:glycerate kinase [Priestia megaterium]|uniref:Glycerate kinase family protein n=1 Tax=Priestia megaterium (strain ATCC 14581 / DSM 32 / CCUG 1817 / JCM 2506 / NBRC 15308 / NCIMB 9376 / NCTC 10342 / NRRL B-14308 / VKM B-512 / Ford 19) TaxID=1348623 RepID=A0A0B6AJP1_PRIM2|nr:glycerate kinase [Priestia megaterium]AJI21277.1 glycerate kinase family protein [Priestia megaterium NBRC 15308 = ATCC 14581]KFM97467.1 glycerate kinase family protein [Priestia megaterium]KGJ75130.1 glycerate kinase [Priestia megaterium NBRC 15308 = ATCC 14581]MDR4234398.1 glycerate kinase [Priestia megaterium]MED3809051.1 glycerate kinase [Priestia megaterium]